MTSAELRALAVRLEKRHAAPSLDGYNLADGLRAAADLLDGFPGPIVHDDIIERDSDKWPARVPLRSLL